MADTSAYGVRCLSAYLRSKGRVADILSLRLSDNRKSLLGREPGGKVPDALFKHFLPFVENYDCIGISLFSDGLPESIRLTAEIKRNCPDKMVIWGSIHPTLKPAECLEYADYVCVGEGYYSLEALMARADTNAKQGIEDLPKGIWTRREDGTIRENGCSRMCSDLDSLPFPNYDKDAVYVRNNDHTLSKLDREGYRKYLDYVYYTMLSQGCPNSCAYCCNYALKQLDAGYSMIRKHSVNYILEEIKAAHREYAFYNVFFMDDSFILMDNISFDEFVERYPREIGLPFIVTGFIPRFTKQKHVEKLVKAGMIRGRVGVQTGSNKMLGVYNRRQSSDEIINVSRFFAQHKGKIVPTGYDIILDGYGETVEDTIETVRLISKIKKPFILNLASLKSYPGTKISEYMDNYAPGDSYIVVRDTVINSIIGIMSVVRIPGFVLDILLKKKSLLTKKVPSFFTAIIYYAILVKKTIFHLYYGDFSSKPCWLVDIIRVFRRKQPAISLQHSAEK